MDIFGLLILGLGLFFLGMRLVGENLRRMTGPSFRSLMARTTGSPVEAGVLGLVFGALMQSATAVTFILVSMVSSGLVAKRAALRVIAWTNVGLTALAFIVTLNIHPIVAYLVGLSAVGASLLRKPTQRAFAGVLLGIGLIFFGLETMGGSARPLVETPWFRDLLHQTVDSPAVAFLVGIAVAAVLQSNTASTMLIITLADAGAFHLDSALMLIYGTNLGAIVLRLLLAAELRGTSLQLVRFEDLFCLVGGAIMVALFYTETLLGVPLVRAAITWISPDLKTQLALAFLLSNLLPAVAISMFQGRCQALLAWFWPATEEEEEARPKFIKPQALADPDTAMDLLQREIARLLRGVRGLLTDTGPVKGATMHVEALGQLAESIDGFAMQLAAQAPEPATAHRLNLLREEFALVRYLKETTHQLCQTLIALEQHPAAQPAVGRLLGTVTQLLDQAVRAMSVLVPKAVDALRQDAKYRSTLVVSVQEYCWDQRESLDPPCRAALMQAVDDVRMIAGFLHHLAKLLADVAAQPTNDSSGIGLAHLGLTAGQAADKEKG